MEMHQVRYFLAVARTLNFTRAADECNVAQPSLTRAIKLLEAELGGDLFRRERPHAMLTPLGERMFPLLKQCYDSAQSARALAEMMNDGEAGALKLAVSTSVELGLILPHIGELRRHFTDVELRILRGSAVQIAEFMKSGEAELAVGAPLGDAWDRLDCWPLFEEGFDLVFNRMHRLANHERIEPQDLESERYLVRAHCERDDEMTALLRASGLEMDNRHEVWSDQDFLALVDANMGLGFLPRTVRTPPTVARAAVSGLTLKRAICLHGVAGRQRTPIAATFMKMLRAANWSTPGQ